MSGDLQAQGIGRGDLDILYMFRTFCKGLKIMSPIGCGSSGKNKAWSGIDMYCDMLHASGLAREPVHCELWCDWYCAHHMTYRWQQAIKRIQRPEWAQMAEEIKTKATQKNAQANFDLGCSTGNPCRQSATCTFRNGVRPLRGQKKAQLFTAFSPVYFRPLL
jgi:hypothetical protein